MGDVAEGRRQQPLVKRRGENKGYVCRSHLIGAVGATRSFRKSEGVKSSPQGGST